MRAEKFRAKKDERLSKLILSEFSFFTHGDVMKIIRQKDVKINGNRTGKDEKVNAGDEIEIFFQEKAKRLDVVYEDDDIIVAFKPRKIETVSKSGDDFLNFVSSFCSCELFAVHRLDMNTTGLVVFAKNENSKNSLDEAFKNRTIEKFYLARVKGSFEKKNDKLFAYLKKDEKKSHVEISKVSGPGFEKIQTNYLVVKEDDECSILEVELVTGKTHQIRAHLAFMGHPIVGDEKYGDVEFNKKHKTHYQNLCAYKIIFHFDKGNYLSRLDGKVIELSRQKIDFLKNDK